ncbi:MAG: DUF4358 domain-containing protein [Oscillospiraceae bacterium]
MKKIISILLSTVLLAGFAMGCTKKDNTVADGNVTLKEGKSFNDVVDEVKNEYGEDYLATMEMDEARFVEATNINMENVEEFYSAEPMISAHVDRFIAIQAKPGKGAEVEKELNTYRDTLVNDTMQYPSNVAKIQSSEVKRYGDYVYFVLLGSANDNMDATEDEQLQYAKNEIKRGIDKIESFFNL